MPVFVAPLDIFKVILHGYIIYKRGRLAVSVFRSNAITGEARRSTKPNKFFLFNIRAACVPVLQGREWCSGRTMMAGRRDRFHEDEAEKRRKAIIVRGVLNAINSMGFCFVINDGGSVFPMKLKSSYCTWCSYFLLRCKNSKKRNEHVWKQVSTF